MDDGEGQKTQREGGKQMKIVYDDIVYSLQKTGGVSVMWTETTRNPPFPAVHIRYDNADKNMFAEKVEGHEYEIRKAEPMIIKRAFNIRRHESEPFIFHSSYYRYCLDPKAINITNLYDCTFERYFHAPVFKAQLMQKKKTIMHSDGVLCISENTKYDLLKFYPEYKGEIAIVYCGYDTGTYFYEPAEKERIVLFVGSRIFYKRFDLAVVAYQAPPSMGFSRQEYWSGSPFPSPGDHPNPGIEPASPALAGRFFRAVPPGKLVFRHTCSHLWGKYTRVRSREFCIFREGYKQSTMLHKTSSRVERILDGESEDPVIDQ